MSVEVNFLDSGDVLVCNGANPAQGTLQFTADEWDAFIGNEHGGVKAGEFDRFGQWTPEMVEDIIQDAFSGD